MATKRYYVNKNSQMDGYHEVHVDDGSCPYPPEMANRQDLGWHATCADASQAARNLGYRNVDGCYWCNRNCHTR